MTDDDYKNWYKMGKFVITNSLYYSKNIDEDTTDLIHNLYLRFNHYEVDFEDLNDSYVYMSLKNLWNDTIRKRIKERERNLELIDDYDYDVEDEEYDIDNDHKTRRNLNSIKKSFKELDEEHQQIYYLYFIKGISMDKISKYIDKNKSLIRNRVVFIKEYIKGKSKKIIKCIKVWKKI